MFSHYWTHSNIRLKCRIVFSYLLRKIWSIANGFWAVPASLLICALRTWRQYQFVEIPNNRIGHFVAESVERFHNHLTLQSNVRYIYYFESPVSCNSFWDVLVRRTIPIHGRYFRHIVFWLKLIPSGRFHIASSVNLFGRLPFAGSASSSQFEFSDSEKSEGLRWLREHGWNSGDPIVCLIVRDAAYLANDPSHGGGKRSAAKAWSYHSYRDSDIDDYVLGIQWLLDQGVFVIRMGKLAEKKVLLEHPSFLDYPFLSDRSDFLDIWLFANASATISTGTGPDIISNLYHKPVLYLNFLPLFRIHSWAFSTTTPKNLYDQTSGRSLNLIEYLAIKFMSSESYVLGGVDIVDLSSEQIRSSIKEFWRVIQPDYLPSDEELQIQTIFWSELKKIAGNENLHHFINPTARISETWMREIILDQTPS
jgi:putative glycosyltransferase (TIGR04372 family)